MNIESNKNIVFEILKKHNFDYIFDNNTKYYTVGIGDIILLLANMQNDNLELPVKIPLNIFINGKLKYGDTICNVFSDPINNFEFRIKLINDIIIHQEKIKKTDFIFILNNEYTDGKKFFSSDIFFKIEKFKINVNDNFFIKHNYYNYIIFHTKLRLSSDYNYRQIKKKLKEFFCNLKINNKTIIILGEREFPKTWEGEIHKITTIYDELLCLKNLNANVIDLTIPTIYNNLNYELFKNDLSLINKASFNICFGQGGPLCLSLFFGKCIFYNPIDTNYFFRNLNLYKSGHIYFEKLDPMLIYMRNKVEFIELLNKYNFKYRVTENTSEKFHGFGLGDLLFNIVCLQNKIITTPIQLSLDFYCKDSYIKSDTNEVITWNNNSYNSLEFKLKLLSDICENNKHLKKNDIIFISNINNIVYENQFNLKFPYDKIVNYRIKVCNNFYNYSNDDTSNYIIFHTKMRLNSEYDYNKIKQTLRDLFSNLKIKKSNKIYLLGEREFEKNYEANIHNIQTIYSELQELYKNNNVKDLTIPEIYNSLNYENYKKDMLLISKAKWNIVVGHGGHLCTSLIFGNCIFYDPIDETYFFQNMNLYNSGHRYFKKIDKFCEYLLFEL
jgi:ribonucleotide monophosphatase NagD (HAD superfamily)